MAAAISALFKADAEKLNFGTRVVGESFAYSWHLGDQLNLELQPSCRSLAGRDCAEATRRSFNTYQLQLEDPSLVRLELQAIENAKPRINPKPKF
jgi:hypothetical protein